MSYGYLGTTPFPVKWLKCFLLNSWSSLVAPWQKNLPAMQETQKMGSIPGSGRSPGEGNGNLLHYCLENPMDRGAWWTTVHGSQRVRYDWSNWARIHSTQRQCFLLKSEVENLPEMRETQIQFLSWEDPLVKEMATHSSILAWRIPWTEEPNNIFCFSFYLNW